jgi:two-component system cell cycle response regulator
MTARVLIVDDEADCLSALDRQLGDEFFDTLTADCGEDALALARREAPDLILLDALMPGLDGFETCRRLKADPETAHIPVVMMTTVDQPAARLRGLSVGADDFLVRPVRDVELFARVRSLVRLKTLFDEIRAREATGGLMGLGAALDVDSAEDRATIVVVDDGNERIPEFLTMLRSFGIVVTVPADRAIDRLRKTPCDIAVVGLTGGRLDGLRLVSRLRSHSETRQLPVLAFVDGHDTSPLVKGFELGINDCVKLPVDMLEVVARVRTLLRRKRLTERMRQNVLLSMRLATTDAVTGLYNRHYMTHHLSSMIARARAGARPVALMMVDIDYFKRINDTWGHAAGDKALRVVADRLAANVRGVDLSARYGGEEFVVVMPDTDLASATAVAERLRSTIADDPVIAGEHSIPVTISIGVAVLKDEDEDGMALLSRADHALYAAKRGGRNRVVQASAKEAAA